MDKLDQARAFRAAGDHGAAAGLCREVLAADPGNAEALVILGAAHAYRQEWPEAIACFDTALGIVPTHEDAWLSRGE